MMKKLLYLGSVIAMILAAQGCDRNNIEPDYNTVTWVLNLNQPTKTSLVGRDILWEDNDTVCCLSIYDDDRLSQVRSHLHHGLIPQDIDGRSAVIKVTCGGAYTPKHIIYPSSMDVAYTKDGLLEIPVPNEYTLRKGDIPHASNISVGQVDEFNDVLMKNVMALIKFEVEYPENINDEVDVITQITISSNASEAIAGKLLYNPEEMVVSATEGTSTMTLRHPEGDPYFLPGTYYFPLPSITLSEGLKVNVTYGNRMAEKTCDLECDLQRNYIINIGKTSEWTGSSIFYITMPDSYIMDSESGIDNIYVPGAMTMVEFDVEYPDDFSAETDGITQITILSDETESIAGAIKYDYANDEVTVIEGEGVSRVTICPPEGELYFSAGKYRFLLPSMAYNKGITIVSKTADRKAEKTFDSGLNLKDSDTYDLGNISEWDYENTIRVLSAAISDGSNYLDAGANGWPFTGSRPNITYGELTGEFHLPDNEDIGFRFYVHSSTADSWRSTKGAGFRFGGTEHDYMLLPAIPGYRLASVYILSGKAVKYAITNHPDSGAPTPVAGGEEKSIGVKSEHTFTLTGTAPNTAYRLDLPTTTEAALYKFTLTYEKD